MNTENRKKSQFKGVLALLFLIASTTLFFVPVLFLGLFKLFPNKKWRIITTRWIDTIIYGWCAANNRYIDQYQRGVHIQVEGLEGQSLSPKEWYLVVANHQSWLDIVLLQRLFHRHIPILKFFIKDQLKWVPLLGFSWWAMGSPFMKRYSKQYLQKNPHKKGEDLKATQKALELFKESPSSIMNFIEGTRFTSAKQAHQQSPYNHLLKPKAGGIAFVISAMSEKIHHILDVTIVYSDKKHSLWDFLCQRIQSIHATVRVLPIPNQFISKSLSEDETLQQEFRHWLNGLWDEKDKLIGQISQLGSRP